MTLKETPEKRENISVTAIFSTLVEKLSFCICYHGSKLIVTLLFQLKLQVFFFSFRGFNYRLIICILSFFLLNFPILVSMILVTGVICFVRKNSYKWIKSYFEPPLFSENDNTVPKLKAVKHRPIQSNLCLPSNLVSHATSATKPPTAMIALAPGWLWSPFMRTMCTNAWNTS